MAEALKSSANDSSEQSAQKTLVHAKTSGKPYAPSPTAAPPHKPAGQVAQQKKVSRRGSKPIINWFQRKLAGTVKTKRVENLPLAIADLGNGRSLKNSSRVAGRIASSPIPAPASTTSKQHGRSDSATRRKTISLNDRDDDGRELHSFGDDNTSLDRSSFARDSVWSPASAVEADEDASLRPIPPSSPPSPSPSRSSSSYLSDPRTFRSMAASTKPTTLLSIDMNGGMAHIAQAPPTPTSQIHHRVTPHVRQSSSLSNPTLLGNNASITFSHLPQSSSRPSSHGMNSSGANTQQASEQTNGMVPSVQAPLHTAHHPRNNPRPSSPPLDNASVLTLASSAFAFSTPGRPSGPVYGSTTSGIGGGDSVSHFGGSTYADMESRSEFVLGDDLEERDIDASVRALRPRSSRRGSWESEASRWSARVQLGNGTPSLARERSLWTANSVRSGMFSTENGEASYRSEAGDDDDGLETAQESPKLDLSAHSIHSVSPTIDIAPPSETESPLQLDAPAGQSDTTPRIIILRQPSNDTVAQVATGLNVVGDKDAQQNVADVVAESLQLAIPKGEEVQPAKTPESG